MKKKSTKKSQALWSEAKRIIPGGSQLLSKRAEMHLPSHWPAYYAKAKGVKVTDIDGNVFTDMSLMGVGSCTLGYADPDVTKAVKKAIALGAMSTLNAPEEVELAKVLLALHPWARMVRFARTGGEALSIAVRIARAHSGKEKVAFCGYHGWHDWYLSSNLSSEKNLDGHLLPGLEPRGVPRVLRETALPFKYNDSKALENILKKGGVGTVVIEPVRHQEPKNDFLQKVRKLASAYGAVLIADEVSAGFRLTLGGSHLKYNLTPDIAVFSKALGNGHPIAAVIGTAEIMKAAEVTFISSTYWTERVGPAAALAVIEKMKQKNVPKHLEHIGKEIERGWKEYAKKHDVLISTVGPYALVTFSFEYKNSQELKTLFVQEMLKRGFLAGPTVYVSLAHTMRHVKLYMRSVDEVFAIIADAIRKGDCNDRLDGPVAHSGFARLT